MGHTFSGVNGAPMGLTSSRSGMPRDTFHSTRGFRQNCRFRSSPDASVPRVDAHKAEINDASGSHGSAKLPAQRVLRCRHDPATSTLRGLCGLVRGPGVRVQTAVAGPLTFRSLTPLPDQRTSTHQSRSPRHAQVRRAEGADKMLKRRCRKWVRQCVLACM